MEMPWKVSDLMSQRFEFCQLAMTPGVNFSALCRQFTISRQTGYKWLQRFREEGYGGLYNRSRRPRYSPGRIGAEVEAEILELRRRYPYWGPRKLRRLLEDRVSPERLPALVSVARILQRHGLTASPLPQPEWPSVQRFAAPHPNDLWQMDLKAPLRLPGGDKIYPVGILDDHSRYLLGLWVVPHQTDNCILTCWIEAARQYGLPQRTLTDHGPQFRKADEFTSAFHTYLWACGVQHIQGRVAHPQTQGKIERFWRTLNLEVLRRHSFRDLTSWQKCFDDWRQQYNQLRPHEELGNEPPARCYRRSERPFTEPERHQRSGRTDSLYRRVNPKGEAVLGGWRLTVGRGFAGWTVEARPADPGYWRIYFRGKFIREFKIAHPAAMGPRLRAKWGNPTACPT